MAAPWLIEGQDGNHKHLSEYSLWQRDTQRSQDKMLQLKIKGLAGYQHRTLLLALPSDAGTMAEKAECCSLKTAKQAMLNSTGCLLVVRPIRSGGCSSCVVLLHGWLFLVLQALQPNSLPCRRVKLQAPSAWRKLYLPCVFWGCCKVRTQAAPAP